MGIFVKVERSYTVLELNSAVRQAIKRGFPRSVWVCGEIQDLRASKDRRHIYLNLVQKHPEANQIIAKVNAAIFENRKSYILRKVKEIGPNFELKNDIEVRLLAEVDLYPRTGSFSLIVSDIDPVYTLGKVAKSRQKIFEDLKEKGLLEKNKSKEVPLVPLRVGLVTAVNSAAYHDFINELSLSGYGFSVSAYNCHMQGKDVQNDVLGALRFFNKFSFKDLDLIVITRGGGSTADLSWFDNKKIAAAIANSRFPVFSALGHQINITIADMVAHTFLKTPTKAAQDLIERVRWFSGELNLREEGILKRSSDYFIEKKRVLEEAVLKIDSSLPRYFRFQREELLEKRHRILSFLKELFAREKQKIEARAQALSISLSSLFGRKEAGIRHIEDKIKLLNPRTILKRGYSITLKQRKALKRAGCLKNNDLITTVLFSGRVISQVKRKEAVDE